VLCAVVGAAHMSFISGLNEQTGKTSHVLHVTEVAMPDYLLVLIED
jgi:hypothetical protein